MPSPLHICTVEELRFLLTETELSSVSECVAGEGEKSEEDFLTVHLLTACDRVVSAVNACRNNARIAYGKFKVPASCVHTALVLARHAVISAIPGMSDTLEGTSRESEYKTAVDDLARLAACELDAGDYAAAGDDPDVQAGGGIYVIGHKPMAF